MRNSSLSVLALAWIALGASAPLTGAAAGRPDWIAHPKSDDSLFLYRVGSATGQPDLVTARNRAREAARAALAEELLARAGVPDTRRTNQAARLELRNVEIIPGAVHTEDARDGTVSAWVQVSFPLVDQAAILARLAEELGAERELVAARQAARARLATGDYPAARSALQEALHRAQAFPAAAGERPETVLLLAEICAVQNDHVGARQAYEELTRPDTPAPVRNQALNLLRALPPPPRAWPLHSRWSGRSLAVVSARRETGSAARPFRPLADVLHGEFGAARLATRALPPAEPHLAALMDDRNPENLFQGGAQVGAQLVLAVLLTTDPARLGKTETVMGIDMPMADTVVAFAVLDVPGRRILYEDRFREVCGPLSEQRLAERVATRLIGKYLVEHCPAVERPGGGTP